MNRIATLFIYFFLLAIQLSAESDTIRVTDEMKERFIGSRVSVFTDSTGSMSVLDVLDKSFSENNSSVVSFEPSQHAQWIQFSLKNELPSSDVIIELDYPVLDYIALYEKYNGKVRMLGKKGEKFPFAQRDNNHPSFLFKVDIPKGETKTFFLKAKSGEVINLPIFVGGNEDILSTLNTRSLIYGIYAGVMLVMFFYNFFIYLTTRIKSYLYYVLYIAMVGLVQATLNGYSFRFFWPNSPEVAQHSLYVINALTALFSIIFFFEFVSIKKVSKTLYYIVIGAGSIYIIELVLVFSGNFNDAYSVMNIAALLLALSMLVSAVYAAFKKSRTAIYFSIAWGFFLTSVIIFVLKDGGVLEYNLFTANVLEYGSGLETIMLAFGLADYINVLRKQNEVAQKEALDVSKENERLIKRQNIMLEQKVQERTKELSLTNSELNEALDELKEAQTQLVEQEKMASLGQLTAGIAHEINNPINFVTANVNPLKRDIEDIIEVLEKYQSIKSVDDFKVKIEEINELIEELEVDYLKDEINSLLKGIDEGARRTAEIVRGLKVFSRAEEQDIKKVDLLEGLESTVTLLNSTIKNEIKVERDFKNIPKVECYAGKINQVFMNILSNAVQAVKEDKSRSEPGKIMLKSFSEGDEVFIQIIDNGPGIDPEVISKVFEPFFTTKPVGEGTGLGLSITRSIIQKHNGDIKVENNKDRGVTFTIKLPKYQVSDDK
ncbi:7TM diverse intracellular signaling domain-containing protein [Salibacter sp.]|uniref:sensor histidine kinase n=1 Tax=Salibacter sp. TaxID=2010995 RepID=UPI00287021B5|nr:7TM diverse intracellular signaling domain-containing protein [Salibacter sp.]MDR9487402.1 7TM diverse intracellular signaling domain-containing protein [Salibacter sp.]